MPVIEVLTGIAGADFSWRPGELVEMDQADADKWADGYRARLVDPADRETTVPPAPERTEDDPPAPRRPTPPPKKGPGSGDKAWQDYAAACEVEVPATAKRDAIWPLLDAAGVPTE